jgi:hypothetical protein
LVSVFLKKKGWKTEAENPSSSPASRVQGKKKTHSAVQNKTILGFFFNEQWIKRRHFGQNTPFHFKEKGSKNMSKSKSVFNLKFIQSSPKLQF